MVLRAAKLALFLSALVLLTGAAFAQDGWRWQRGDGDHDRDDGYYGQQQRSDSNRYYSQGMRDGRADREHNRRPSYSCRGCDDRRDRDAYSAGYRAGYGNGPSGMYGYPNGRSGNGGWGNGGYGNGGYGNGGYGRGGPYNSGGAQAYNYGFQDGLRHGSQDRSTGHSYRPTHDDDYRNADRGFYSGFGNKQDYKNQYRSGYMTGYQRGWNSGH